MVCGTPTWYTHKDGPDTDWQDAVKLRKESQRAPEPESLSIPDIEATIVEHKELKWVPHDHLIEGGYRCLESFATVKMDGRYYELQGHVKDRTGDTGGMWWIEEVPEPVVPDTIPETFDG